jgi:hypothetical protein
VIVVFRPGNRAVDGRRAGETLWPDPAMSCPRLQAPIWPGSARVSVNAA